MFCVIVPLGEENTCCLCLHLEHMNIAIVGTVTLAEDFDVVSGLETWQLIKFIILMEHISSLYLNSKWGQVA